MKRIVLFGAGKSSTCLIEYLTKVCTQRNWLFTIGDASAEVLKKLKQTTSVRATQVNVEDPTERNFLIQNADLVISLLPPALHLLIAKDCLALSKHMLTASYVDDEIKKLVPELVEKRILFLCEMGLDPGIDHMSAMQIIDRIHRMDGKISVFRSHTGGLVAPESDDNPWHYKISWNPANVVKAGSAGAIYKENGQIRKLAYQELFENTGLVEIKPIGRYAWYPNRDSLLYIPMYGLESTDSFIRTTLRHPDFCTGWKNLVKAGLTSDETPVSPLIKKISEWSRPLLPFVQAANKKQYDQLGLFEDRPIPPGASTSAKILQVILEEKWKMKDVDKDMVLMLHEFEYAVGNQKYFLRSSLVVKGENAQITAMAKTVGLPLGIAAKLILEKKLSLSGLHIPIIPEIYEPVLKELTLEGIQFFEEIT